jgi:hypothetical protein
MSAGDDIVVRVTPDDPEEAAALTYRLRTELLDLDVESVEPATESDLPEGTKGVGLVGAVAVRLGKVALKSLVTKVRDWASRNNRAVEITIDGDTLKLTGATPEQQDRLLTVWLAKHAPSP